MVGEMRIDFGKNIIELKIYFILMQDMTEPGRGKNWNNRSEIYFYQDLKKRKYPLV